MLNTPAAISVDSDGNIYVLNNNGNLVGNGSSFLDFTITIYAAHSTGNVSPMVMIAGSATQLGNSGGPAPPGIAVLNSILEPHVAGVR